MCWESDVTGEGRHALARHHIRKVTQTLNKRALKGNRAGLPDPGRGTDFVDVTPEALAGNPPPVCVQTHLGAG